MTFMTETAFCSAQAEQNKQTKEQKQNNTKPLQQNKPLPKTNNTTKNKIKFIKGFPK